MNLALEINLHLFEEQYTPDEIARLALGISDFIRDAGYGNVGEENPDDTRLTSVVLVRPVEPKDWIERAVDAMAVNFPTDDEKFVAQAEAGGIPEVN